jgi:hypothetical protein
MKVKPENIDLSRLQVIIESTRWCNQECGHCIRGDRQKRKQKIEQVKKLLSNSNQWSAIMFSGGDPSLAIDIMEDTLSYLENTDTTCNSFWIATNGLVTSRRFFGCIESWADYMSRVGELCGIRVSTDYWHQKIFDNKYKFTDLEETIKYNLNDQFYVDFSGPTYHNLIDEGRAVEIGGSSKPSESLYFSVSIGELGDVGYDIEGNIYLTVKGSILSTCDLSFIHADEKKEFYIGEVEDNLADKIAEYLNSHPDLVHIYDNRIDKHVPVEQFLEEYTNEQVCTSST